MKNRKDLPLLVALIALWVLWPQIDKQIKQRFFPTPETPAATETVEGLGSAEPPALQAAPATSADVATPDVADPVTDVAAATAPTPAPAAPKGAPEKVETLENDKLKVTFSSLGASVKEVVLKPYRSTIEEDSGPVTFDFSGRHALTYAEFPGLTAADGFTMKVDTEDNVVRFEQTSALGVNFVRTITMDDGYLMTVEDSWTATADKPVALPTHTLQMGPMVTLPGEHTTRGLVSLGLDALMTGGDGVKHWGNKIPRWFEKTGPNTIEKDLSARADWLAVKNRFFVQVMADGQGLESVYGQAARDPETRDVTAVSGRAEFASVVVEPGVPFTRTMQYYVGPKKLSELKALGMHLTKVMELGWFAFFGKFLLGVMNFIHDKFWPYNYGVAIILLTFIMRTLFWPLTHKGTESMKKLQKLQPLMKEIQAKYKPAPSDSDKTKRDKTQKQQQAMMGLYKEHKVNPMMGCLPMVVQIPVFISFFYLLRSAIELRFAKFLWISDLSDSERIFSFGFSLPLLGWDAFNLLPLLMVGTTFLQQKLTPTTGDASQQRIMMLMPFMMLFFLYDFASGLMLYWVTNNVAMIVQQFWQRRMSKDEA